MDALTEQRHRGYIQAGLLLRLPYSGSLPPLTSLDLACRELPGESSLRHTASHQQHPPLVDDDGSGDGLLLDFVRRENWSLLADG
ncbi:hypothetical protein A6A28_24925 [Streptomyces sp. CB03578]|nr:hypothetical protein A6A28_24925 [Streptomyces sp. CB03578]